MRRAKPPMATRGVLSSWATAAAASPIMAISSRRRWLRASRRSRSTRAPVMMPVRNNRPRCRARSMRLQKTGSGWKTQGMQLRESRAAQTTPGQAKQQRGHEQGQEKQPLHHGQQVGVVVTQVVMGPAQGHHQPHHRGHLDPKGESRTTWCPVRSWAVAPRGRPVTSQVHGPPVVVEFCLKNTTIPAGPETPPPGQLLLARSGGHVI